MIGLHVSHEKIPIAYSKGIRAFQIFIGSPQGFTQVPSLKASVEKLKTIIPPDATIIVHAPYWLNYVKPAYKSKTMSYLKLQLACARDIGAKFYVTHMGYRATAQEFKDGTAIAKEQAVLNMCEFFTECADIVKDKGVKVCFENCPGAKNDLMFGSVAEIACVHANLPSLKDRYGFVLDTAHAFANGEMIDDVEWCQAMSDYADIIHLNCPSEGELGGHKDRHTSQSVFGFPSFTPTCASVFIKSKAIKILESEYDIAMNDIPHLVELEKRLMV